MSNVSSKILFILEVFFKNTTKQTLNIRMINAMTRAYESSLICYDSTKNNGKKIHKILQHVSP